jgi:F420-0:gamma-glutamyl ligase
MDYYSRTHGRELDRGQIYTLLHLTINIIMCVLVEKFSARWTIIVTQSRGRELDHGQIYTLLHLTINIIMCVLAEKFGARWTIIVTQSRGRELDRGQICTLFHLTICVSEPKSSVLNAIMDYSHTRGRELVQIGQIYKLFRGRSRDMNNFYSQS